VAHIALAHDGNILYEATGIIQGEIAPEPKGSNGFGYDPIFYYPPYDCTLAEVDGAKKAAVSHRGKAFKQLRNWLESGQLAG
jgi:XTP/dITP diphosphohydrolase